MPAAWIAATGTATPPHRVEREQGHAWLHERLHPAADPQRLRRFVERCGVDHRRFAVDLLGAEGDELYPRDGTPSGSAFRNRLWVERAADLAMDAIDDAGISCADGITHIITTTCTGAAAPGLDIMLARRLDLPADVQRLGINFLGCYAALPALRTAADICAAQPYARVLVVSCELCSLHFQPGPADDALIGACLFADGAGAALVCGAEARTGNERLLLAGSHSQLISPSDNEEMMAWTIGDHGFELALSPYVGQAIGAELDATLDGLLPPDTPSTACTWLVHPGGPRIIHAAAKALGVDSQALRPSWQALAEGGNRSSATMLAMLDSHVRALSPEDTQPLALMAFGPGLTVESLLMGVAD